MEHISDDSSRLGEFDGDVAAIGHLSDGNQRAVRMHVPKIPCQKDTFQVVFCVAEGSEVMLWSWRYSHPSDFLRSLNIVRVPACERSPS